MTQERPARAQLAAEKNPPKAPGEVVVMKFGGTSVGSTARIQHVAQLALAVQKSGKLPVLVVSAMSGETNRLLGLATALCDLSDARELDVLAASGEQASCALTAVAIQTAGGKARSFLGHQLPITTDSTFANAHIQSVAVTRLVECLKAGYIPVIAGFQGVEPGGSLTTLGRGGSDTTAVAIAAALRAESCDIYTDVDGVYTADPNLVPTAKKLERVSYDHMLTLATLGAKVLHDRSVELAKEFAVPVHVRTSFGDVEGTRMTVDDRLMDGVAGAALDRQLAHVVLELTGGPATLDKAVALIGTLGIIPKSIFSESSHRSFTIRGADLARARAALDEAKIGIAVVDEVSAVSLVGSGLAKDPRFELRAMELLNGRGIKLRKLRVTATEMTLLVEPQHAVEAMRVLHDGLVLAPAAEEAPKPRSYPRRANTPVS